MKKLAIILLAALAGVLPARAQKVVADRGYDMSLKPAVLAPKSSWVVGGNLGFSSFKTDNYSLFIIGGINTDGFSLGLEPYACYHFSDNLGAGCYLSYKRDLFNVANAAASFGDLSIGIKDYSSISHRYSAAPFIRYYMPFGDSRRFGAFVDGYLKLGGSQGKQLDGHTGHFNGVYTTSFVCAAGANAGIMAYLSGMMSVSLRVGLLELNYTSFKQVHAQVAQSKSSTGGFSFMIDPLSISFGMNFLL